MIRIAVLAGDGIGPEVMAQTLRVLERLDLGLEFREALVGGAAYEVFGSHLPQETIEVCHSSSAILFGSVGGPVSEANMDKWRGCETNSILKLRKEFGFHANFRPVKVFKDLTAISPLRPEVLAEGVDILIIRELLGDIYFGEHSTSTQNGMRIARDVAEYNEKQIREIAIRAFEAARRRRGKVTSVDKANVLDTSKLWRSVIHEMAAEYKEIICEDMLVDNCAMQLIKKPGQFDVILTANLFGDILSDAGAVIPGSLGLTPSASFSQSSKALYEPSGGSAPDIAGKDQANPIAQLLSAAMMLRYSLDLENEALRIENAIERSLEQGYRTNDIYTSGTRLVGCRAFTDQVLRYIVS